MVSVLLCMSCAVPCCTWYTQHTDTEVQDAIYRALSRQRNTQANERGRTAQKVEPKEIMNAQRLARLREPASMKSAQKQVVSTTLQPLHNPAASTWLLHSIIVVTKVYIFCINAVIPFQGTLTNRFIYSVFFQKSERQQKCTVCYFKRNLFFSG